MTRRSYPSLPGTPLAARERQGLWLGLLGVVIFSLTLPMTRLATGTGTDPQLDGVFIALGRGAVAGVLSVMLLGITRAPRPQAGDWPLIAATAAGAVFGFPLCTSIAMRHVEAVHASVMLGVLPLATAAIGARVLRQRPSRGFWLCAAAGSALVVGFALLKSGHTGQRMHWADALLLMAMGWAAMSYVAGARLAGRMRAEHAICWALAVSLPVCLPMTVWLWPAHPVRASAWAGFAYVAVLSMWIGFFAWYRGLALGGTVRVSQVQLVQPFLSMVFAVPLLGESLDALTLAFGIAVVATVILGKRMPVNPLPAGASRT